MTGKGFLWCLFACMGITLLLAAPASAGQSTGWTVSGLDTLLSLSTEVSVLAPSSDPDFRGYVEMPVFDNGNQVQEVHVGYIVKIEATLEIDPDMPLPMQIRVVFGGPGYQTAPREWTLRYPGTYRTRTYFVVSSEGENPLGAKAWVKSKLSSTIATTTVFDDVVVGDLP
jgi:hypothetical protein